MRLGERRVTTIPITTSPAPSANILRPGTIGLHQVDTLPQDIPAAIKTTKSGRHRTGAGARMNADALVLYRAVNAGVIIAAAAAIGVSWSGLYAVGAWLLLEPMWAWLVPVMIDVPIVVMTLGMLAKRSRGESLWLMSIAAYGLTAVSSAANFIHVAADERTDMTTVQGWLGSGVAGLAPMLVLLTTEVLGSLVTKPPRATKASKDDDELKSLKKKHAALERQVRKANKNGAVVNGN